MKRDERAALVAGFADRQAERERKRREHQERVRVAVARNLPCEYYLLRRLPIPGSRAGDGA